MRKIIFLSVIVIVFGTAAAIAQTTCPPDKVCISQEAANAARDNALEIRALKEKINVLEAALKEKDASVAEVQETARKNETDLKAALQRTEIELATKTGQLIGAEAMNVRQTAIIEALLKMVRKKKVGLINIF